MFQHAAHDRFAGGDVARESDDELALSRCQPDPRPLWSDILFYIKRRVTFVPWPARLQTQ
jgi:hypothetical protein